MWKAATKASKVLNKRHAMLSYAWGKDQEIQAHVIRVRKALVQRGIDCWMDVGGGMKTDIYDSMAEGVENAAVVICFMNQSYQESENCQLELKFAKQSGLPFVPVMLSDDPKWKASGWLGIVTAGALWTPLDLADFENSVDRIASQVKMVAITEKEETGASEGSDAVKAELKRLREDLEAATSRSRGVDLSKPAFDPSQPAVVPQPVPQLPKDFRETDAIVQLRRLLTATRKNTGTVARIGFWGMGKLNHLDQSVPLRATYRFCVICTG